MPIQKATSKVLASGQVVSGNYWAVERTELIPNQSGVRAYAKLYTSASAFVSGAAAIWEEEVDLTDSQNPVNRKEIISLVENKLITIAGTDFNGGTVVP